MRRRALLRALPAAGGLALAGCLDRARSTVGSALDDPPTDDRSTPDDAEPAVTTLDGWKPAMLWLFNELDAGRVKWGEAAEVIGIGSGEDSHWITVAAEAAEPVETTITIRPADGESLYETTVELTNERYFGVRFAHARAYEVAVETGRHEETIQFSEDWIDCNESGHVVLLAEDGTVRSRGASTDMAC